MNRILGVRRLYLVPRDFFEEILLGGIPVINTQI